MAKQVQKKSPPSRTLPPKEKKIESNTVKNNDSDEEIITKQSSGAKPIKEQPIKEQPKKEQPKVEYQLYSDLKISNSNINYSELYRLLISNTETNMSLIIHTQNLSEDNINLIVKDILPNQSKKVSFDVTLSSCVDGTVMYKNNITF